MSLMIGPYFLCWWKPAWFTLFIIPIIFLLPSGLPGDGQLLKAANTINHVQVYLFPKTSHWSEISHSYFSLGKSQVIGVFKTDTLSIWTLFLWLSIFSLKKLEMQMVVLAVFISFWTPWDHLFLAFLPSCMCKYDRCH